MKLIVLIIIGLLIFSVERKGYRLEHFVSPKRWKLVFTWLLKLILKKMGEKPGINSKYDILNFTYRTSQCSDCLIAGKCKHCQCDTEGLFNSPLGECSMKKFGPSLSNTQWDDFLKENNIEIDFKISKK